MEDGKWCTCCGEVWCVHLFVCKLLGPQLVWLRESRGFRLDATTTLSLSMYWQWILVVMGARCCEVFLESFGSHCSTTNNVRGWQCEHKSEFPLYHFHIVCIYLQIYMLVSYIQIQLPQVLPVLLSYSWLHVVYSVQGVNCIFYHLSFREESKGSVGQ
jgi:hypothetical protein